MRATVSTQLLKLGHISTVCNMSRLHRLQQQCSLMSTQASYTFMLKSPEKMNLFLNEVNEIWLPIPLNMTFSLKYFFLK